MTERLDRIEDKLHQLRSLDASRATFGAENHEFRLVPALTAAELSDIEARYTIALPSDYREFVLGIGNGGAGPGYGLERFGWVATAAEIPSAARTGALVTVRRGLQRPRLYDSGGREISHFDVSFYDLLRELAGDADPTAPSRPFPLTGPGESVDDVDLDLGAGSLYLAHYGCDIVGRLVLNGPFAGQIWILDGSYGAFMPFGCYLNLHDPDCEPDASRSFSFTDWYEHWLDTAITALRAGNRV